MSPLLYSILYSADVWRHFLNLSATSPGIEGIENRSCTSIWIDRVFGRSRLPGIQGHRQNNKRKVLTYHKLDPISIVML